MKTQNFCFFSAWKKNSACLITPRSGSLYTLCVGLLEDGDTLGKFFLTVHDLTMHLKAYCCFYLEKILSKSSDS